MRDVELGPEESSVIAAARDAHAPTEMQRARVRKGLEAKLAAGIAAPLLVSSTALATGLKIGTSILVLAALGTGAVYVAKPHPSPKMRPPTALPTHHPRSLTSLPSASPPAETQPASEAPAVEARPVPAHARSTRGAVRRREASPPPDDLAGELALLTQISAATKQGDVTRADELLRTYDQRSPPGDLAQERAAAGIFIHCAASRVPAARAEARRFLERWPRSPFVARVASSCAAGDKAP
jgi:hypothetical protein